MKQRIEDALIKRKNWKDTCGYLQYCEEVRQNASGTLRFVRVSLNALLHWAGDCRFTEAEKIRPTYPQYLSEKGYSVIYTRKALNIAQNFFQWASKNLSYYAALNPDWVNGLRQIKLEEDRVKERELYTLDDVMALVHVEARTLAEERDRAAVAFLFLSGMRGGAFVTLPIQAVHVDVQPMMVCQWPALGVHTKNGKACNTYLLQHPELEELQQIVKDWHKRVAAQLEPEGLWYAIIEGTQGVFSPEQSAGERRATGLARRIKALCERAGVPPMSSHKLRHGHAVWALKHCATMEDLKAVSQNLMHASLMTTDSIYGVLPQNDVSQRILSLGGGGNGQAAAGAIAALELLLQQLRGTETAG